MNLPQRARSWLFVPGDSERKLTRALAGEADRIIIDLEDSVAPVALPAARALAAATLRAAGSATRARLWVRINALDSPHCAGDLEAIVPAVPAGVLLPKAASAADCKRLAVKLEALERRAGQQAGAVAIMPIAAETPAAALSLASYQVGVGRVSAMTWGAEDLASTLGATRNRSADGELDFLYQMLRAQCLLAARAAGVLPIDTVYPDFRDPRGLAAECATTAAMGFAGKLAIHPDQLPTINAAYTPGATQLQMARRIVQAFADSGSAVVQIDGRMYDRPHLRQAEQLLAAAGAAPAGD